MKSEIILARPLILPDRKVVVIDLADEAPRESLPLSCIVAPGDERQLNVRMRWSPSDRQEMEDLFTAMLSDHWTELLGQFEGHPLVLKPRWHGHGVHQITGCTHFREYGVRQCVLGQQPLGLETLAVSVDRESAARYCFTLNKDAIDLEGPLAGWMNGESPSIDVARSLEHLLAGEGMVTFITPRSF